MPGVLAVSQESTPGLSKLPGTKDELAYIKKHIASLTYMHLENVYATPADVLDAMEQYECVHLAAGMLIAGYPSVIATMWSISDDDAPSVADKVYFDMRIWAVLFRYLVVLSALVSLATASNIPVLSLPDSISESFGRTSKIQKIIDGGFYDAFSLQTFGDPTYGRVKTAFVDEVAYVLLRSNYHGDLVAVLDLIYMPTGCGAWTAFRTVTTNGTGRWPSGGEIDIIEWINNRTYNLAPLYITPGCDLKWTYLRIISGKVNSDLCDAKVNGNRGRGVGFRKPVSFSANFNSGRGGYYATSRSKGDGVDVGFWGRDDPGVPEQIESVFSTESCDMDERFRLPEIMFDLTFCGDWAGSNYSSSL
ncbi:hypothetical protein BDV93DRAFT_512982 [Ceratobasidium sp. AG-I]|nr:hypothetical protein BDV93DRAFT_512982 [Ceratobasidium sp. AG-I]